MQWQCWAAAWALWTDRSDSGMYVLKTLFWFAYTARWDSASRFTYFVIFHRFSVVTSPAGCAYAFYGATDVQNKNDATIAHLVGEPGPKFAYKVLHQTAPHLRWATCPSVCPPVTCSRTALPF